MQKLAIEKETKLLYEFGKTMVLISYLENLLISTIAIKNEFSRQKFDEKLSGKTLGKIIKMEDWNFITKHTAKELEEINNNRIFLAHGLVYKETKHLYSSRYFYKKEAGPKLPKKISVRELQKLQTKIKKVVTKLDSYILKKLGGVKIPIF